MPKRSLEAGRTPAFANRSKANYDQSESKQDCKKSHKEHSSIDEIDDVVCAVCKNGEEYDRNSIILCDGCPKLYQIHENILYN